MVVTVDFVGGLLDRLGDLLVLVVELGGLWVILAHGCHLVFDGFELLFVVEDRGAACVFELCAFVACFIGHDEDVDEVVDVNDTDFALANGDCFGAHRGAGPDGAGNDECAQEDGDGE